MNFPNTGLNQGEDTVRVGDQVYTEGTPRRPIRGRGQHNVSLVRPIT